MTLEVNKTRNRDWGEESGKGRPGPEGPNAHAGVNTETS